MLLDVVDGTKNEAPSAEDFIRALALERNKNWYMHLEREDGDYIEALVVDGALRVEVEERGVSWQSISVIGDDTVRSMFASFLEGGTGWREQARWRQPPKPEPKRQPGAVPEESTQPAVIVGAVAILAILAYLFVKGWGVLVVMALTVPGLIGVATLIKQGGVQRARRWTRASGCVVTSEMSSTVRHHLRMPIPHVVYEFTIGFDRFQASRVSFADLIGDKETEAILARYPAGKSVTVYYDPDDPSQSVIERELPTGYRVAWAAVALMTAAILGAGLWMASR